MGRQRQYGGVESVAECQGCTTGLSDTGDPVAPRRARRRCLGCRVLCPRWTGRRFGISLARALPAQPMRRRPPPRRQPMGQTGFRTARPGPGHSDDTTGRAHPSGISLAWAVAVNAPQQPQVPVRVWRERAHARTRCRPHFPEFDEGRGPFTLSGKALGEAGRHQIRHAECADWCRPRQQPTAPFRQPLGRLGGGGG